MPVLVDTARTTASSLEPCSRPETPSSVLSNLLEAGRGPLLIYVKLYAGRALQQHHHSGDRSSSSCETWPDWFAASARADNTESRSWEVHMDSPSSPVGSSAYLESLMRAGQQSMKQFDDALASAMGVEGKPATGDASSPFAVAANLQRQYWSQIVDFWKGILVKGSATGAQPSAPRQALPGRGLASLALLRTYQAVLPDDLQAIGRARRSSPGRRKIKAPASLLRASIH